MTPDNTTPAPTPPREQATRPELTESDLVDLEQLAEREESAYVRVRVDQIHALIALAREAMAGREAFSPVRDWFDGDGERTNFPEMLSEAVAELQDDRKDVLRLSNELRSMTEMRDAFKSACDEKLDQIDRLRAALKSQERIGGQ